MGAPQQPRSAIAGNERRLCVLLETGDRYGLPGYMAITFASQLDWSTYPQVVSLLQASLQGAYTSDSGVAYAFLRRKLCCSAI